MFHSFSQCRQKKKARLLRLLSHWSIIPFLLVARYHMPDSGPLSYSSQWLDALGSSHWPPKAVSAFLILRPNRGISPPICYSFRKNKKRSNMSPSSSYPKSVSRWACRWIPTPTVFLPCQPISSPILKSSNPQMHQSTIFSHLSLGPHTHTQWERKVWT